MIREKCINDDPRKGNVNASGKLTNPGKKYFLTLAANVIQGANEIVDEEGLNLAQKSMMRCGLSLDKNGNWDEAMLFPHPRDIINKYYDNFSGVPPQPL